MPLNLNYSFNFGVILMVILLFLIITGVLSVLFYNNNLENSFTLLILHGYNSFFYFFLRVLHNTFANMFFLFMFLHILRSWYYTSSQNFLVLLSGFLMFVLSCGIAFFGYCLPMGQMSYWAAIVIFSLLSVLPFGLLILLYIFGSFAISTRTLSLLFFLHFITPFILSILFIFHFLNLHNTLSTGTLLTDWIDLTSFYPYYILIDIFIVMLLALLIIFMIFFSSLYWFETANFVSFNTLVTPLHIYPDWFLLFPYACLRSIDNKLIGVILLLIIMVLFFYSATVNVIFKFNPSLNFLQSYIFFFFILMMFVGSNPSVYPYSLLIIILQFLLYILVFSYLILIFFFRWVN